MISKHFLHLTLAGVAAFLPALTAAQDIFVCTDADGRKVYQNTGASKGCKRLSAEALVSVPAPRLPVTGQPSSPLRPAVEQRSFPRVDGDTQRARDNDRRRILEDELKAEEERLNKLRAEFNSGQPEKKAEEIKNLSLYQERVQRLQEDVQRSENNLVALKRELSLARNQ